LYDFSLEWSLWLTDPSRTFINKVFSHLTFRTHDIEDIYSIIIDSIKNPAWIFYYLKVSGRPFQFRRFTPRIWKFLQPTDSIKYFSYKIFCSINVIEGDILGDFFQIE